MTQCLLLFQNFKIGHGGDGEVVKRVTEEIRSRLSSPLLYPSSCPLKKSICNKNQNQKFLFYPLKKLLIQSCYVPWVSFAMLILIMCLLAMSDSETPWILAPPSMGCPRQEYWIGFLLQGIFLTQGSNPSPALQADSLLPEPPGRPC